MRWVAVVLLALGSVAHANPRRHGGGPQISFPIAAADYRKLVEARFVMFKSRLEERMKTENVADAKREVARKKALALQTEVMKKVDQVGADKTVTKPEAMQVRQLDLAGRLAIWKELGIQPLKRQGRGTAALDNDD